MDSFPLLDRILAWVFLPATLYGAGGALINARRSGKSIPQTIAEAVGGAVTANVVMPLVQDFAPERWHYTLFFLVGWGGLEAVGRLYGAALSALERRIQHQINPHDEERM